MPRAHFTLNLPEREPDEPDISPGQREEIDALLKELKSKDGVAPAVLDKLGERQAVWLIDGLTEVRRRAEAAAAQGGDTVPTSTIWTIAILAAVAGVLVMILLLLGK
jgi:hypothetical protein